VPGERVLFVDDEELLTRPAGMLLARMGFDVRVHTQAEEALRDLEAGGVGFDALLTDLHMPGMSGLALIEKARALHPLLPVALCFGLMDAAEAAAANSLGVEHFLRKPYTGDELGGIVTALLARPASS